MTTIIETIYETFPWSITTLNWMLMWTWSNHFNQDYAYGWTFPRAGYGHHPSHIFMNTPWICAICCPHGKIISSRGGSPHFLITEICKELVQFSQIITIWKTIRSVSSKFRHSCSLVFSEWNFRCFKITLKVKKRIIFLAAK